MSIIYIEDNFISSNKCNEVIEYYNKSIKLVEKYGKTYPLNITNRYSDFSEIFDKVIQTTFFISKEKIQLQRSEIVKWPVGSNMSPHYDPESDVFSCIIYLNDNFDGGETCFEDNFKISPKSGKILIFSNSLYLHWVDKVRKYSRYTLCFWFVKQ